MRALRLLAVLFVSVKRIADPFTLGAKLQLAVNRSKIGVSAPPVIVAFPLGPRSAHTRISRLYSSVFEPLLTLASAVMFIVLDAGRGLSIVFVPPPPVSDPLHYSV